MMTSPSTWNAHRVLASIAIVIAVASGAGIIWSVVAGDRPIAYLFLLAPSCIFWYWLAAGFLRRGTRQPG